MQRQHGRRERIERHGLVGCLAVPVRHRAHRQLLHGDVAAVQRRALRRQGANRRGMDAVGVRHAGHLHAAAFRQVRHEPVVHDVAVQGERLARGHGLDNAGGVLTGGDQFRHFGLVRGLGVPSPLPGRGGLHADLASLQVEAFAQFGRAAEVGQVLRVVDAALGHEVAEVPHDLAAHRLVLGDAAVVGRLADGRVQVLAVALEPQHPALVVDARHQVADLVVGHADPAGQLHRGALHAVAEADVADPRRLRMQPREHGHGVRVVDQQGVGAEALDVPAEVKLRRRGAQEAEDAPRADGVRHVLVHAVAARDVHLGGVGLAPVGAASDRDRRDDEVRPRQQLSAFGGAEHRCRQPVPLDGPAHVARDARQAVTVDVAEGNGRVLEGRAGQDIYREAASEAATGADDHDLGHQHVSGVSASSAFGQEHTRPATLRQARGPVNERPLADGRGPTYNRRCSGRG
ncbi:MAG: hypothetical protein AMK73_08760 [Planctomycetes bacterium SM23_32]|nr:MAG: hypothetical protein AMK73_08760 [Planctomycetes bacterium SM23_32]